MSCEFVSFRGVWDSNFFCPQHVQVLPGHEDFTAHDDGHGDEAEPDEQGDDTDQGAVGQAHVGYVLHIVAVQGGQEQPEKRDEDRYDEGTAPTRPEGVGREVVVRGQGHDERSKGEKVFRPGPDGPEHVRKANIVMDGVDDGVAEDSEAQGHKDGKGQEQHENHGLDLDDEPVLFVPVLMEGLVAGLDEDLHACSRCPEGHSQADDEPDGAARGQDPVHVGRQDVVDFRRQVAEPLEDE